jgi:glycerate 2-kinase
VRILVAPCAYKGTYTPRQVADAIATGVKAMDAEAEIVIAPLADGGDGTIDVVREHIGGDFVDVEAADAVGRMHKTHWLNANGLAFLELSTVCGLGILGPSMRAPLLASTYGLGQALKLCCQANPRKIFITVGGSASTDGGAGVLQALGAKLLDSKGNELGRGGAALAQLEQIDLDCIPDFYRETEIEVLVDVKNPLLGPNGAARTFSLQKGASPKQTEILEAGLTRFADRFESLLGKSKRYLPGSGAAGGAPFGLAMGLDADIVSGAERIADISGLEEKIIDCDLVITGEGRFDEQSLMGKATGLMLELCRKHSRKLQLIAASVDPDFAWQNDCLEKVVTCVSSSRLAELGDIARAAKTMF